jgi:hypothetical protein
MPEGKTIERPISEGAGSKRRTPKMTRRSLFPSPLPWIGEE